MGFEKPPSVLAYPVPIPYQMRGRTEEPRPQAFICPLHSTVVQTHEGFLGHVVG